MDPPFRLVETAFATYLVIPIKTNLGRCFFCIRGARHGRRPYGRRGRRFRGCRGRRSPPPRRASSPMSTPPYTAGLVHRSPSPAARRLPTPTPPEEAPHRCLVVRIRRPRTQTEGVGVIPDMNVPAQATETTADNAGFGPQAGPAAIHSFTPTTMSPSLARPSMAVHPSLNAGTMAAHRSAAPLFSDAGGPPFVSSTTANQEAAAAAPNLFGRVRAVDRRLGIRRGTWSPTVLGLPSSAL
jgi:hypothetical protein